MTFGIKFMVLAFVIVWLLETEAVVQEVTLQQEKPFNPYLLLHIDEDGSFGTSEIRQAYHKLSLKYHPDKVNYQKVDRTKALRRYNNLVKAYGTLTKKDMYDNYIKYGDPDGPKIVQAFDLALPRWLLEESIRPYVITALALGAIFGMLALRV